jgi:hypothetical protein
MNTGDRSACLCSKQELLLQQQQHLYAAMVEANVAGGREAACECSVTLRDSCYVAYLLLQCVPLQHAGSLCVLAHMNNVLLAQLPMIVRYSSLITYISSAFATRTACCA